MEQLEKAVAYAKSGVKIFPCNKTKKPLISKKDGGNGFADATTDLRRVKAWWRKHPNALIGAPNDQFTVIDIDDYDLCPTNKLLTESAINRLKADGVLNNEDLTVRTMSGGTHVYFKKCEMVRRSISCLPNIDLLGDGGYVILPDQKTYVSTNNESPWNAVSKLRGFDYAAFSYVQDDFVDISRTSKELKRKSSPTKTKKPRKETMSAKSPMRTDISGFVKAISHAEKEGFVKQVGMIDYENNTCEFSEQRDMYEAKDVAERSDPEAKLLDEDGKIHIDQDVLDSKLICHLFHNQEVQNRMAEALGLKKTKVGRRSLMNSILPDHKDTSASMGIRWSADNSHIVVRDFANFFSNRYNHCDYNLIRLYATQKYKTQVNRLSPAEFVAWFTRLLFEANIIDLSHVMPEYYRSMDGLGTSEKKVAESFLLLEAVKRLYSGYSGKTTFADKFSAAWCGVSVNTVGKVKKRLVAKGFLEYCGTHDCSGGKRPDGFYETPLYRVVTEKKMRISDFTVDKQVRDMQERRKQEMSKNDKGTQSEEEKDVQSVYPNLGTIYGLKVTDSSFKKIKAFCEDFGLDTMTMQQNMFIPLLYSEEFIQDVMDDNNATYFVNNFELVIDDPTPDGDRPLIAIGESPAYDNLWNEINSKHSEHKSDEFEEASPHFVLAFDVDPDTIDDLDAMTVKFNEYMQELSFQGIKTMYLNHEQMEQVLDGKQPNTE